MAEEVQRRYPSDPSERAKQLVREGRIGGAKFGRQGGRPRVRRASELANDLVEQNAQKMQTELGRILRNGSDAQKLKAMDLLLRMGMRAEALDQGETKIEQRSVSREVLIERVAKSLSGQTLAGSLVRQRLAEMSAETETTSVEIVDAVVVEDRSEAA